MYGSFWYWPVLWQPWDLWVIFLWPIVFFVPDGKPSGWHHKLHMIRQLHTPNLKRIEPLGDSCPGTHLVDITTEIECFYNDESKTEFYGKGYHSKGNFRNVIFFQLHLSPSEQRSLFSLAILRITSSKYSVQTYHWRLRRLQVFTMKEKVFFLVKFIVWMEEKQ